MPEFKNKEEYEEWKAEKNKSNADKFSKQEEKAQESHALSGSNTNGVPVSFSCPKCLSENIQKASLIVSLETKELKATSATVGIGVGSAGGVGVGIGVSGTSTNGTITAALAQQLRPPTEPKKEPTIHATRVIVVIIVFLSLLLMSAIAVSSESAVLPLLIMALIFAIYIPIDLHFKTEDRKKYEQAKTKYKSELAKWEKTFSCMRCGEIFQVV